MGKSEFKCVLCQSTTPQVSLFKFPPDNFIKKRWLEFCQIERHNTYTRLCHLHFRTDLISNAGCQGRHVLKRGAIPSIEFQKIRNNDTKETKDKKRCCYLCGNKHNTSSYFGMKKEWANFCNVTPSRIPPNARLCSNHFIPDDFVTTGIFKRLKKEAMPSINVVELNNEVKKEWANFCNVTPSRIPPNARLRRNHFIPDDFVTTGIFKRLKKVAMPSIHVVELNNEDVTDCNSVVQHSDEAMHDITPSILAQELFNDDDVVDLIDYENCTDASNEATTSEHDTARSSTPVTQDAQSNKITSKAARLEASVSLITSPSSMCPTSERDADCVILPITTEGPSRARARRLHYVGDVTTSDLMTPRRDKKCFQIAHAAVVEKDRTIKTLRQKQRRLSKRITSLQKFVEDLLDENLISEQAKNLLIQRLQKLEE